MSTHEFMHHALQIADSSPEHIDHRFPSGNTNLPLYKVTHWV